MKFLRRLLRSFYPARCPYCGKVTTPFEEGCKNCVSQNPGQSEAFWIYHPYLGNDNIELICCSAWPYWDKPKAAVLRFKFHGRREYAEAFGLSMARSVKENFSSAAFDLVCEIPLTKRRRRERGFDQARLLAKELARGLKLPYVSALEKPKGNRIQHELSFAERWENVKGVYRLKRKIDVREKLFCFATISLPAARQCGRRGEYCFSTVRRRCTASVSAGPRSGKRKVEIYPSVYYNKFICSLSRLER